MPQGTAIEWTDATWSPVTGCTRVSPGCAHCYIERTPPMRMNGRRFTRVGNTETTGLRLHPERLDWKKVPRGPRIFVCSMSDLFHDEVPDEFIAQVFETMRWRTSRVFQILTKRPERACEWFAWYEQRYLWNSELDRRRYRENCIALSPDFYAEHPDWLDEHVREKYPMTWPLPNVWVGVSVENARYTWRADVLREIPAAVRFISAEPLLGSLYPITSRNQSPVDQPCDGEDVPERSVDLGRGRAPLDLTGIDWLIAGGESGPGARPVNLLWIEELLAACRGHDVAPFVKQLGARPVYDDDLTIGVYKERPLNLVDAKGGDIDEWPAHLRVREFPRMQVPA